VIPTIIDGDFILYESRAICKYLDDRFPNGTSLVPKDVKQRALMEQWLSVETSNVTPLIMKIVGQLVFSAWRGAQPDLKVSHGLRRSVYSEQSSDVAAPCFSWSADCG